VPFLHKYVCDNQVTDTTMQHALQAKDIMARVTRLYLHGPPALLAKLRQ
jgi:hypothetical protein